MAARGITAWAWARPAYWPAALLRRFLPGAASGTVSISVFQAPQPGHLPSQRGLVLAHSLQV